MFVCTFDVLRVNIQYQAYMVVLALELPATVEVQVL
jgi:hypothetical protein